jgi:hypothetical protein
VDGNGPSIRSRVQPSDAERIKEHHIKDSSWIKLLVEMITRRFLEIILQWFPIAIDD